ncbi:MAG: hypothetical protein CVU90_11850 [Firmicutes bacterium HGW-Firmicutes-15]|nr:MAG: hypothetical protein CVU90_11850 [Firmicutes bacterium HGW-Firmicutes-15]
MKLAEALILRADKQKKIEQLRARLTRSAKVQEGEKPPEDPKELLTELNTLIDELTILIKKINKTNSLTEFIKGESITDSLATRDTIILKRSVLESLIQATVIKLDRYSKSEVKFYSTVNIANTQKETDFLSKQYRELDTKIQEKNWLVDLIED